jgi:hypothetical protein
MNASIRKTPVRRDASTTASASAAFIAKGFSHRTCLAASTAAIAQRACIGCGVAM